MLVKIQRHLETCLILVLAIAAVSFTIPAISAEKVDINTATMEELQALPKIGPKTAKAIVEYRKMHSFKSVDELINVKGIGDKKFEKLRPLITVGDKSH